MGRNQIIASVGYGSTVLMSYVLVWAGKLDGTGWVSFVSMFVPIAVGTVLFPSAALKAIKAKYGKDEEKQKAQP